MREWDLRKVDLKHGVPYLHTLLGYVHTMSVIIPSLDMYESHRSHSCHPLTRHRGSKIHFLETLHALAGRVVGESLPEDEEFTISTRIAHRLPQVCLTAEVMQAG